MTRRRVIHLLVRTVLAVVILWIVIGLLKDVDWSQVWDSISGLDAVEIVVLLLMLFVLRVFNASPLWVFIKGLSLRRAVLNDISANLVSTVAPPPSDMVMRYGMFKEWRVDVTEGFAGVILNSLLYYVIRFATPALGLLLLLSTGVTTTVVVIAGLCLVVGAVLAAAIVAIIRAEVLARRVGHLAGRAGHRVAPTKVDPDVWATKMVEFREGLAGDQIRRGWFRGSLLMFVTVLVDGIVLVYSLRTVDIPTSAITFLTLMGIFLVVYPLTALPFAGLGVLDAFYYQAVIGLIGPSYESAVVAGLVIWRTVTLFLPLVIGAIVFPLWKRAHPHAPEPTAAETLAGELPDESLAGESLADRTLADEVPDATAHDAAP